MADRILVFTLICDNLKIFEMEESSNDYDLNLKSNDMSEHIRLSLDDSGHDESQNLDNSTIENVNWDRIFDQP